MLLESSIRRFLKHVSFARSLPRDLGRGTIVVSPGCDWRFLKADWHRDYAELLDVARHFIQPNDIVWDIGANVGVFTFAAAERCGPGGRVISLEPDPQLAYLLNRSRRIQAGEAATDRVRVVSAAISDTLGIVELVVPINGSARNHLSSVAGNSSTGEYDRRSCVSITADWLMENTARPDFVKVDVEGAELMFLRGASRLLREQRPTFYIEVNEENQAEVSEVLAAHEYSMFAVGGAGQLKQIDRCTFNTLARPSEKLSGGRLSS